MSAQNSDSESSGIGDWTVVNRDGEIENGEDGSSSSSLEFVNLQDEGASYHHRERSLPDDDDGDVGDIPVLEPENTTPRTQSPTEDGDTFSEPTTPGTAPPEAHLLTGPESEDIEILTSDPGPDLHDDDDPVILSGREALGGLRQREAGQEVEEPRIEEVGAVAQDQAIPSPVRHLKQQGESDSDSDFVRLDPAGVPAEEMDPLLPESVQELQASTSSGTGSSISASFRFVHPAGQPRYQVYPDDDEDSLPSDIDDRCESDISGVAADESDLSSMTYSIGDIPLTSENVPRSYRHRPNPWLNSTLTTLAVLAFFLAVGIGIGHYIGTSRESWLRSQQVAKMKSLQDDYLMCLREQEIMEAEMQQPSESLAKMGVVVEQWRQKYEELLIEKAELEHHISKIQAQQEQQMMPQSEMKTLKEKLNHIQIEKQDLQAEVARLRYSQYPANQQAQSKVMEHALKDQVNQLVIENEDLKSTVGKMRYTSGPGNRLQVSVDEAVEGNDEDVTAGDNSKYTSPPLLRQAAVDVPDELMIMPEHQDASPGEDPDMSVRYMPEDSEADRPIIESASLEKEDLVWRRVEGADVRSSQAPGAGGRADTAELAYLQQRLAKVQHQLNIERSRSELWQGLFQTERTAREQQQEQETSPSFLTCLSLLLPKVNFAEFSQHIHIPFQQNISAAFQHQWMFFQNITSNVNFVETLNDKWTQFQKYTESPEFQQFQGQAQAVYNDIQNMVTQKWKEFHEYTNTPEFQAHVDRAQEAFASITETIETATQGANLQGYVNKTKSTMSKLTETLQDTWQKVKNLSSDFLKKHDDTMKQVQAQVAEIGGSIRSDLKKVQEKVSKVAKKFHKSGTWVPGTEQQDQAYAKEAMKANKKSQKFGGTHRRPYKNGPGTDSNKGFHYEETFGQNAQGQFEDKPLHKQKQSNHEPENYNDFWNQAGFDPDDLLQEGFFEGNNREWRKHKKRLHKLHGRINRLNEDILTTMDDDDIEDIYDDLEDFQDDIEDEVQPEKLKNWLTCQIRWWKSRFQRKHRNQDIIQGCGKQLMHWQLRALCKGLPCKGKKCKAEVKTSPLCQQILTAGPSQGRCSSSGCHKENQPSFQQEHKVTVNFQDIPRGQQNKNQKFAKNSKIADEELFTMEIPEQPSQASEETVNATFWDHLEIDKDAAEWYFRRVQDREDHHIDPTWYLKYMEDREDQHHDPDWYVQAIAAGRAAEKVQGEPIGGGAAWEASQDSIYDFVLNKYRHDLSWLAKNVEDLEQKYSSYFQEMFAQSDEEKWTRD